MTRVMAIALAAGAGLGLAVPDGARAGDPEAPVVEEILGVLRERGILEQAEHDRLVSRYQTQEAERRGTGPRIRLSGDLRLRGEAFWYDEDAVSDRSNRYRGRYRARIAADAEVNDWMSAHLRLASGQGDNRSANTSFGRPGPDFDSDPIYLDRASLALRPPEHWLPPATSAVLEGGKQPNPFLWKAARDSMLWDNDITPEGVALRSRGEVVKGLELFANAGYFVIDEYSGTDMDPELLGAQLGAEWAGAPWSAGLRASGYGFRSLDPAFLARGEDGTDGVTASAGNLPGLFAGDSLDVGELGGYAGWHGIEGWPLVLFGYVSNNFSAERSPLAPAAGDESLAWMVGLEIGDKAQVASFGAAYIHLEANAFPSQYVDSNLVDGETNREGFAFQGMRQILPHADFIVTLFLSDALDDTLPDFEDSVGGSRRMRLQTDLVVGF